MKILQINTVCDHSSTGCIVTDIAAAAEQQGHTCVVAYGQRNSSYLRRYKIGGKLENHLHNLCSRLFGYQGYYTTRGTKALIRYIQIMQPDIIHFHNLHGNYLNLPLLFDFLDKCSKPIIFTLHDCWIFTGKCSHFTVAKCYKWKTGCMDCPQYKSYPPSFFYDRTTELFNDKKRWFSSLKNVHIVTVSEWLQKQVQQSFLREHHLSRIYNWVDCSKFYRFPPNGYEFVFNKYHLTRHYKYVLSVSANWNRNSSKFQDALLLASKLPAGYKLLLVGSLARQTRIPKNIYHIPYTEDTEELAAIYSMAVGYIHLSVEDTFGKVIAEAMACGTMPIVYNSTACAEIAGPLGFIVEPHEIDKIIKLLPQLDIPDVKRKMLTDYVKAHYAYEKNIRQYINLYEQITRT